MKKRLLIIVPIIVIFALISSLMIFGSVGTFSWFSDQVTSNDNTITAGELDLKIDSGDTLLPFTIEKFQPGETKGSPTYMIKNVGNVPGVLSFKVINVSTNENGVIQPESAAGDSSGVKLDPDNFTIATGDGELLDQVYMTFWVDDTSGQRPAPFDWQDNKFWSGYPDESGYYSLPVNTDLLAGKNVVLQPGQTLYIGVVTMFIDDTATSYGWILDGVLNNAAMGDDIKFDIILSLNQIVP
jgi:predicted ribosomally synthesized peptide with SipW-like signal peptide